MDFALEGYQKSWKIDHFELQFGVCWGVCLGVVLSDPKRDPKSEDLCSGIAILHSEDMKK